MAVCGKHPLQRNVTTNDIRHIYASFLIVECL